MNFLTNINNKEVTVELNKKRGMKHTYMRLVSSSMIRINSNIYFTENDARNLIEKKKKWLEKNLLQLEKNTLNNDEFLFLGIKHKNFDNRNLDRFYKLEAQKMIPKLVNEYSELMQLFPTAIKFRKNKRTWGSCNYKNELNFNTLLMKFPIPLIEYVVVHELAHIKHKNHSKRFWNCVEEYCPDYKEKIKEFKSFL
ncbi:SprT family zinc-dependent metalloprotease [Halarcobacter sp.]|uniref:M48 family metallopeptidase n=1 Tax=Halarcobacter sp. TaxID=2321133 RepID=UPI0029F577A2|nr:SprT family zinc-dependent metalloprotease [Halarcobacter sp.]